MKDRPHATLEMRNNETAIPCFILWVVKCILHTHACSKKKSFTNFQWFWIHWTLITHFINYLCQILYCHNLSLFLPNFGETLFELYKKHAEFYDWTIHICTTYLQTFDYIFLLLTAGILPIKMKAATTKKIKNKNPYKMNSLWFGLYACCI